MSMRLDARHAYLMVDTPTLVTCRLLFSSGLDAHGYVTRESVRRPWRETVRLYLEWVGRELGRECYERERRELRYATRGGRDPEFEML